MKKILCLVLALVMVLSLIACGKKQEAAAPAATEAAPAATEAAPVIGEYVDPYADVRDDYDALSEAIYLDCLGEFYEALETAKASPDTDERYALMAVAEAKLMESGVYLPLTSQGGNYAISRVAPKTVSSIAWGLDYKRYHNVVVTTEPITAAHRDEMKAKYAELKGTGTYEEWAEGYLVEQGYTLKDTYTLGYPSDPKTWNLLATYRAADSEAICNTVDMLVEYDNENVMQPALATEWTPSDDGLTYTFKIREGVKWVDSQGRELAELTAHDFVAGMQHLLDACGGLEALAGDGYANIVGASDYLAGEITDFAEVGVKALDDYTLQYTLTQPTPYFMTMLTYNPFAPLCKTYFEAKGGKFGADFAADAEDYTYGKTPDDIAYCGAYLVSNLTSENTIVFSANPSYWNAENINMKTITWLYNDGQDKLKAYNDTMAGVLDGAGLSAPAVEAAKADGHMDTIVYQAETDATSYGIFMNLNRTATANFNDGSAATAKTEDDLLRAGVAMKNTAFRRAVLQALDRGTYNAMTDGEDLKYASMINSYTPGNFVQLEKAVTIDINGTATEFAAGTYYGAIMQAQIDADGVAIKVWDPAAENGMGSSAQFDGWYNPEAAQTELATAIAELAAQGIEVSAEKPIILDLPYFSGSEIYANRANALKQSIETVLGGAVQINLTECVDSDAWYYAGYYVDNSYETNYDIYDVSGWGPDYGDPATYLNTMDIYTGDMIMMLGLF